MEDGGGNPESAQIKSDNKFFGFNNGKQFSLNGFNAKFRKSPSTLDELKYVDNQLKADKEEKKLKKKGQPPFVSFVSLFRYATWLEVTATWFGIFMGLITAWGLPLVIMIYGEFTNLLVERNSTIGTTTSTVILSYFGGGEVITNGTLEQNADALADDAKAFGLSSLAIAGVQFITGVLCVHSLNWSANRQIVRIRLLFLKSVLRQDMAWYDTQQNLNFASKITDDLNKLNEGMGEKIGMFCYLLFSFVFSVTVAFLCGWKLTLVVMTSTPVIIICAGLVAKAQSSLTVKELNSYSHAGSAVEEVLSAIRTVIAFGGEDKEIQRYAERLEPANKAAVRRGMVTGLGGGIMWVIMYCSFSLAFWYGVALIQAEKGLDERNYTPGILVIVLWGIVGGAQNLGLCSPHTEAFAAARGAAHSVFEIIARKPIIDSMSEEGVKPEKFVGNIKLTDVYFKYPSRPDVKVLNGINLEIKTGETVALVGSSGCGKSTVLQLIQRLYDPSSGRVEIDDNTVPSLNVAWLRSNFGVVGQEPVLFSGTIKENIARGKPGCSDHEIEKSAIAANCHDFISKLPFGYNTVIGERGAQLSGGQKQRIAIARSLIKDPKVLLLDEATSALDAQGEKKVQQALDKASFGRTTVMVSHRLATVTNASRIVYIDQGKVMEQGTHDELLAAKGFYWKLVQADLENQQLLKKEEIIEEKDDDITEETHKIIHPVQRIQSLREASPEKIRQKSQDSLRRVQKRNSISSVQSFGRSQQVIPVEDNDKELDDDDELETEKLGKSVSNWKLLLLNKKEWAYIVSGTISSIIVGGVLPVFAFLFSKVYGLLSSDDQEKIHSDTAYYCGLFVVVGILCGVGTFLQSYLFTVAGVRLTQRLRVKTFANFLRQEMGWYDDQSNSVGALCARLSGDAAAVQGATGMRIGTILQGISTLVIGVLMAMVFSWKMTLVSLVTIPIVLGGIYLEGRIIRNSQLKERKAMEGASKIATEAIMNIRTVHSMSAENQFIEKYEQELNLAKHAGGMKTRLRGAVYSLGLTAPSFGYGISLYYGGLLVAYDNLPYETVILVSEALIFGSWMLGQVLAFAPNFNAAKVSGARILRLMERVSLIKSNEELVEDPSWKADGAINYSNIEFSYPVRREMSVLRGFNIAVEPGKTVALVGHSGCGKSTAVQLLQRLYEPRRGNITVDEKNITTGLTIPQLRSQLGLVSQEPTLFDRTIAENIAYGDNTRKINRQEIIQAAIKTNIHSFISGLPLGYDTPLGAKGAQLSGGQKQRIAIARALVRNPRILLLDEATSALDTQSEKLVQQALDAAKEGRTCITIAHRLSTIQNADVICVIDKGKVAEKGTHQELLSKKGIYAELYSMQALNIDSDPVAEESSATQKTNGIEQ